MRLTLDYGTDGLEVDLPDERVTVIEPVFREARAECARGAGAGAARADWTAAAARPRQAGPARRDLGVRHHARAAAGRDGPRAHRGDAGHPPRRRHDPHRHGHAPGQHARRARTHARRRHPPPQLRRRQPRQPRRRLARARRRDEDRRAGLPEQALARPPTCASPTGFVEPHFFAGFSGGAEDGRARAWRASRP